ncbi:hypothetical protein MPL1_08322 [Methylophaga lonarensis MPL]|uniref:Secreted protein n=1 Tax=Methylophaga lonarensis MPL TaxID=1286106 RepID=M7P063_9GAMM|nr:hypothetical protein [Methylophaga lonarensis]EMR12851.1 hypothetical protein MPL1_08322 [Methylophaga lonarensis MPL]
MKTQLMALLLMFPLLAQAGAVSQLGTGDPLRLVYVEMQYLYQTGMQIKQQYNFDDPMQQMQCQRQHGYILARASSLVGTAGQVPEPHRDRVIDAGWYAYACVRCSGDISHCEKLPEEMAFIRELLTQPSSSEQADSE